MKTIKFVTCDEYKAYFRGTTTQSYRYCFNYKDRIYEKWHEIRYED